MTQRKAAGTFVDAIALARRPVAGVRFLTVGRDPDQELPVALYHRLVDSLAYAA